MDKAYNMTSFDKRKRNKQTPWDVLFLHETQGTQALGVPILMTGSGS